MKIKQESPEQLESNLQIVRSMMIVVRFKDWNDDIIFGLSFTIILSDTSMSFCSSMTWHLLCIHMSWHMAAKVADNVLLQYFTKNLKLQLACKT